LKRAIKHSLAIDQSLGIAKSASGKRIVGTSLSGAARVNEKYFSNLVKENSLITLPFRFTKQAQTNDSQALHIK
jgi:hypothetical protein